MSRRISSYTHRSRGSDHDAFGRPKSREEAKREIWSSMLNGVSSGKRLPEKSLLVLGGTPETQKDFLEALSTDPPSQRRPDNGRKPPIANAFALGYTYQDVLDADHEDILARLSLYLLTDPSPSFTPLLKPLLTTRTLPNMLIVILLDWSQPWSWVRQLREWIRVLRSILISLDDECKDIMEETIIQWRDKGKASSLDGTASAAPESVSLPLQPGEWDEPLGIPLCVVCQKADKIEMLEREKGWREEEFDFILQYMRTILLKHGASLVYTMPSAPGSLQTLVHSSLGIQSMLKKKELKANHIDRDRILIPPNWDSWGKIRVIRDGFDVEGVSKTWSIDIQGPPQGEPSHEQADGKAADRAGDAEEGSAVAMYEEVIRDRDQDSALAHGLHAKKANGIEVESQPSQEFLSKQSEILDNLRIEDEQEKRRESKKAAPFISHGEGVGGVVEEHIGPVQFNMGGIQVDADDIVKRLKDREASRSSERESSPAPALPDPKSADNETLYSFFANLTKKGRGTTTNSPRA